MGYATGLYASYGLVFGILTLIGKVGQFIIKCVEN